MKVGSSISAMQVTQQKISIKALTTCFLKPAMAKAPALSDLQSNLNTLAAKYQKDVVIVEYSQLKNEVNEIGSNLIKGQGKGTVIWEPLSTQEQVFYGSGKSNELIKLYNIFKKENF